MQYYQEHDSTSLGFAQLAVRDHQDCTDNFINMQEKNMDQYVIVGKFYIHLL